MDIRKLQRAIVDGLEDVKAQNISVFNTEHLSAMFERVIIASGTSNRQTKALASSVRDSVKSQGLQVLATEGEDNGEWIIVDCGAAVAHIMQPAIREYYHLEEIWGGKAVRLKLGAVTGGLVKASEPEAPPKMADRPAGKRAARGAAGAASPVAKQHQPAAKRARAAGSSVARTRGDAAGRPSAPRPTSGAKKSENGVRTAAPVKTAGRAAIARNAGPAAPAKKAGAEAGATAPGKRADARASGTTLGRSNSAPRSAGVAGGRGGGDKAPVHGSAGSAPKAPARKLPAKKAARPR